MFNFAPQWRDPACAGEFEIRNAKRGDLEGARSGRGRDTGSALGFEDLFVLVVCADPEPDDGVAVHDSEGTITDVDPGGPESFDLLKPEGAVIGVCGPEAVLLAGPLLDFG